MKQPWQLMLAWGVLVGIGSGNTAMVLGATIVSRWFSKHRGTVMGIVTASAATGQLVFLPVLAWIVEHYGWRSVTFALAGALGVLLPIVLFFLRDDPRDLGLTPTGSTGSRRCLRR